MKLIYLSLTVIFLSINSTTCAQRVTYSGKSVSLKAVFFAIQKQTGYGFFYDQKILGAAKPVSLNVKNAALTDVLSMILKNQALEYSIENNTILVKKKSAALKSIAVKPKPKSPQPFEHSLIDSQLVKKTEVESTMGHKPTYKTANISDTTNTVNKVLTDTKLPAGKLIEMENNTTTILPGPSTKQKQTTSAATISLNSNKSSSGSGLKNLFSPIEFKKINLGFKGGMNKSTINAIEADGSKSGYLGTELYGGFFANMQMTEKLNLGTELIFSFTDSYHFIELPVHLKYNILEKLNVMAGPKLDYIADGMDLFDYFKRFGVSAEIGTQYKINSIFFAEARYAYGFTPQINSPGFGFYDGTRNTFRLGLGINFNRQEEVGKVSKELGPMRLRASLNTGVALTNGYDIVIGADLRIQKNLSNSSTGMFTVGYNHYSLRSGFVETNLAYFPMKTGIKFFSGNGIYLAPEAGIAIGTKSEVYTYPFVYGAGIGKQTRNGFDISLRYEKLTGRIVDYLDEIKRPAQLALRFEYGFNLNSNKNDSGPFSSSQSEPAASGTRKKSIFGELGGNGTGISANFDIRLKPDQNDGFGIRAGAGFASEFITLPIGLNHILGKRKHGFETGIGITPVYNTRDSGRNIVGYLPWDDSSKLTAVGVLTAGYRFQSYKGFMFRANTSIAYSSPYFSFVWPGLSLGYAFK